MKKHILCFNSDRRFLKAPKPAQVEPNIGFDHQAKKFPCYKNVEAMWRFDYGAEEKKRFRANGKRKPPELMWDANVLSQD